MVDENEFFREATLRICGELEIEKGLQACFEYISKHLPAYRLYLERHEVGFAAMRMVARADATSCEKMDLLVPYSEQAKAAMVEAGKAWKAGTLPPVFVINKSNEEPVAKCLLKALGEPPSSSAMSLPLFLGNKVAGALVVLAEGEDRFSEHHARLFATLKEPFFVAMSNTLQHEEVVRLKDRLSDENRQLHREMMRISGDEIVGADFGLREVMQQVRKVAPTDSPVLLMGETGTGKDVIANAIHLSSPRSDGPFIPVNCGAIPESLIDSELFGHEKGAFTGALAMKRGRFERADKGTILLDEIGEMPLDAQVRLLRVLQHREIERVGGTATIPVDIRIVAATNKDLAEMVKAGSFREDLYYRLKVFPIVVPPLRERTSDIPVLVHHFIAPQLAPGEIDVLVAYDWPGNVRELENVVERAMILHRGEQLRFDELASSLESKADSSPKTTAPPTDGQPLNLDAATAQHIKRVLDVAGGKVHGPGGAGELLGVNPNTLR
ncbi:MAG: sigma-54-dependent Fis family transcriptional regulator, partial [Planctomycetota bacterium]